MGNKIAITTLGTLGDINPMVALALELKKRGHQVSFSTSKYFQPYLQKQGLCFHEVYPNLDPNDQKMIQTVLDPKNGPERFHRDIIFPKVADSYYSFLETAKDADLIVSGILSYFAPLCAKKLKKPWASVMLSPMTFWSIYDPPVIPTMEFMKHAYRFGPEFNKFIFREIFRVSNEWTKPVQDLRAQEGIIDDSNPLTNGATSEYLNLGMYSRLLGDVQPDFPANSVITGFVLFDQNLTHQTLSPGLQRFLASGPPPVVFTLGSNSVMKHTKLFDLFHEVAQKLNYRSVILTGSASISKYKSKSTDKIFFDDYAPYSQLFPHASSIVHQGGIGTTGQAMYSGKPMIVLPECNDQHDNLERARKLGIAKGIPMKEVSASKLRRAIKALLTGSEYTSKAAQVVQELKKENGLKTAIDEIEKLLSKTEFSSFSQPSTFLNHKPLINQPDISPRLKTLRGRIKHD